VNQPALEECRARLVPDRRIVNESTWICIDLFERRQICKIPVSAGWYPIVLRDILCEGFLAAINELVVQEYAGHRADKCGSDFVAAA
jgi:hypothetical protein